MSDTEYVKGIAMSFIGSLLVAVTLAIFWKNGNHEFVWSDRHTIVENLSPHRRAPPLETLLGKGPVSNYPTLRSMLFGLPKSTHYGVRLLKR